MSIKTDTVKKTPESSVEQSTGTSELFLDMLFVKIQFLLKITDELKKEKDQADQMKSLVSSDDNEMAKPCNHQDKLKLYNNNSKCTEDTDDESIVNAEEEDPHGIMYGDKSHCSSEASDEEKERGQEYQDEKDKHDCDLKH